MDKTTDKNTLSPYGTNVIASVLSRRDTSWFRRTVIAGPDEIVVVLKDGQIHDVFREGKVNALTKWETFRSIIKQGPKLQIIKVKLDRFPIVFWTGLNENTNDVAGTSYGFSRDKEVVSSKIELHLAVEPDNIDRFLHLMRGRSKLDIEDIANETHHELISNVFNVELSRYDHDEIRGNREILVNLNTAIQRELSSTLSRYGLQLENTAINWGLTLPEKELLSSQRHEFDLAEAERERELLEVRQRLEKNNAEDVNVARTRFLKSAVYGFNGVGRWIFGIAIILGFWIFGGIPAYLICSWDGRDSIKTLSCKSIETAEYASIVALGIGMCSFFFGLIGVWIALKFVHKQALSEVITGRKVYDYSRTWFAILIGFICMSVASLTQKFIFNIDISFSSPDLRHFTSFAILSIVLATYLSVFLEVTFRGYLVHLLAGLYNSKWFLILLSTATYVGSYVILTSTLNIQFSEYNVYSMVLTGFFLIMIVAIDGGIELAVGYHIIKTLWALIVVNSPSPIIPSTTLFNHNFESGISLTLLISDCVLMILISVLFSIKYKWNNYFLNKSRLTY